MELDRDTLEKAAAEALERPSNSAFWDDRLFTTHGAVLHWAERGDDILAESNYLTALDLIRAAADDGRPDTEVSDEHVIDGTSSHWAVGSLRTIYVQVYEDNALRCRDCGEVASWVISRKPNARRRGMCTHHKEQWRCSNMQGIRAGRVSMMEITPRYTAAFIQATELALSLQDYPILDESDYSEREHEAFEEALKTAVEQAQRDHYDTCEQDDEIAQRFYEDESATHRNQWCHPDDVCWATVAEEYEAARDAYFGELAYEIYRYNVLGYNPDQLELDFAV
ncbi:hypothetical protein P1P75_01175 [Streptomyces sp. ID05-39B]|uniref:hypothetical protein n=1 Tax=Streptomyces sp. ID05-39B TaxID=3028664 RepID=UPI0029AD589D|nr:hypothetical protein [Streptomyces sp. ID05-39B]MDX3525095.1 hypothetical protein [Streptomyces sp. ID05-39B]